MQNTAYPQPLKPAMKKITVIALFLIVFSVAHAQKGFGIQAELGNEFNFRDRSFREYYGLFTIDFFMNPYYQFNLNYQIGLALGITTVNIDYPMVEEAIKNPKGFQKLIDLTREYYSVIHLAPMVTAYYNINEKFSWTVSAACGLNICSRYNFEGTFKPFVIRSYNYVDISTNSLNSGFGIYNRLTAGLAKNAYFGYYGLSMSGFYEKVTIPSYYSEQSNVMTEPLIIQYTDRFSNYGVTAGFFLTAYF